MEIKNKNQQQFVLNTNDIEISNIDALTQREFEIANQTVNQFENMNITDNNLTPEQILQLTLEKGILYVLLKFNCSKIITTIKWHTQFITF
jgi:hypothetical protein